MYGRIDHFIKKVAKVFAEIAGWLLFACMLNRYVKHNT